MSGFCPDFQKKLCPVSVCPAGQGQESAVRIFGVLVHRCLLTTFLKTVAWTWTRLFIENRGVDMDTEFFENRGVDMDMDTA